MGMSNPEFSDPIQIKCDISTTPTTSSVHSELHQQQPLHRREQEQEQAEVDNAEAVCRSDATTTTTATTTTNPKKATQPLEEFKVDDDDHDDGGEEEEWSHNDGFRTPTSLDHRIPEIRRCPSPPRKLIIHKQPPPPPPPPPSSRKRTKLWADNVRRGDRVLLDLSKEVESMFPPRTRANFGRKIKRARSC
ncbi:hypothetical protein Dimus_029904 [Dionaea muscipula]